MRRITPLVIAAALSVPAVAGVAAASAASSGHDRAEGRTEATDCASPQDDGNPESTVRADDTLDVLTVNPEASVALGGDDDQQAETGPAGTSADSGDSGQVCSTDQRSSDGTDGTHQGLVYSSDLVDVLTVNPKVGLALDPQGALGQDDSSPSQKDQKSSR